MIEMTPEALVQLVLNAYREGLPPLRFRAPAADPAPAPPADPAPAPPAAERLRWETSTAFRDRMARDVVQTFWSALPENELKWSALSYRAKNEITDTITGAVKAHLMAHFGGRP